MSIILAEVPTVGQAIRNIVNHFINPLILLASVFFRRSSHALSLERGHRTAQPRVNYTSSLADSLDIRRTNILSSSRLRILNR